MRLIKPPRFLRFLYPSLIWRMPKGNKRIYLTFDDGPHPTITPKVLNVLKLYNAKATFFCIGKNIELYPDTFDLLKQNGHSIGNHTFNHQKGWNTNTDDYFNAVQKTNELLNTNLFRPPYGKIKSSQIRRLKKLYTIIGWSVIAYDWDATLSADMCFNNMIDKVEDGSIVTFHDSEKASSHMLQTLPRLLQYYTERGFSFCPL